MSASILSFEQQDLDPGVYGPRVSSALPPGTTAFEVDFVTSGSNFPETGDVLVYTIDRSDDGGNTWRHDASFTLGPGPWKDRSGKVITTGWVGATLGTPAGAQTRLRETVTVLQSCNIGSTLKALP